MKAAALILLIAIHLAVLFAGALAPYPTSEQHRNSPFSPPSRTYPLGTDEFGRDQLSRLLHGGRISLSAGILAAAVSLSLGLVLGSVAGYAGGLIDAILMRTVELFLALPWVYLLLAVRSALPLSLEPRTAFVLILGVLALIGWARPARIFRGLALNARSRSYIQVARALGASHWYCIRCHVIPDALSTALAQAASLIPRYILAEVLLSMFGLGVSEPYPTWGNMLGSFRQIAVVSSFWWMGSPLVILLVVLVSYRLLSEDRA